ncbi:MAG: hypothetical protein ACI9F9_001014 [Candidatus Paceibacteria bacterium]
MIRIGTAGWSYPDWDGIVYPRPKPKGFHGLAHLAKFFNCVEINSSFYGMPTSSNAQRWLDLVADKPDFRFLAKLHQDFTHRSPRPSIEHRRAVKDFRYGMEPLLQSGKFASLLAQFPVSFKATRANAQQLGVLIEDWKDTPFAVELRDRSWFVPKGLDWLESKQVSLLHVDMPPAKDHPPAQFKATSAVGYLRMHGRNSETWFTKGVGRDDRYNYLYGPEEVDALAEQVQDMAGQYEEVYVITNNHFAGQAVANAIELQAKLAGAPVTAPTSLLDHYPRLRSIAKGLGQADLF